MLELKLLSKMEQFGTVSKLTHEVDGELEMERRKKK